MSIYTQIANLPIIFQVGSNRISEISGILKSKNLAFDNILLLSGGTYSFEIAKQLKLEKIENHEIVNDNSLEEVNRISELVYSEKYDLIIAVGGGTVLDVAKRVSQMQRINHLSIPTIISNDGLISPISVLKDEKGVTHSMSGNMPTGVIIDIDIIRNSPQKYLQAAAGDILSNLSATNDWNYAAVNNHEKINDIGYQLSLMAAHSLVHFNGIELNSKYFLKMVIQGQVNSGIAMALSGSSRPCSGSEHLLSHAIDHLGLSNSTLHGYQVGVLSLFGLYLQDQIKVNHFEYAKLIGLDIKKFYEGDKNMWLNIFKTSRTMRPGRVTILDKYNNEQLVVKKNDFLNYSLKYFK